MALRARLDHDLVYWGPEEVAELGPDDVAAPDDAIRVGCYRWQPAKDGECGHWVPLEPRQVKKQEGAPTLEQAFADYLEAMVSDEVIAGTVLPRRTKAWLEAFKISIDERGAG